jgi:Rps23 Pro-64 3,4-dihydroxylase Tpa1-like proline 4-hydroxylase
MTDINDKFHLSTPTADMPILREIFPDSRLDQVAREQASQYALAQPYPHVVIDGLFDDWILDKVVEEFPTPSSKNWLLHDFPEEIKLQSKSERDMPLFTRYLLYVMNSGPILRFLEQLTGIKNLIGDPHFEGGGLHQIVSGGKLAIHADFNKHTTLKLDRRLNMLVYLNKNWRDEYGGHFELWDRDMSQMVNKIAPIFNRVVIFTTSRYSYHGHPDSLNCPTDVTRKSLALYYYTNGGGPDEEWSGRHSTLFRTRPGEHFKLGVRQIARDLTPPLLWRTASRAFGRRSA